MTVDSFGNVAQIRKMTSQSHDTFPNWLTSTIASMKEAENVNKIKMELIYPCDFANSIFI